SDSRYLLSDTTWTEAAHWIAGAPPAARFRCTAQSRYRQQDQACEVEVGDDGTLRARFAQPQRAVTPGQSLVLYDGDHCLGGAVFAATEARMERHHRDTSPRSSTACCTNESSPWPAWCRR